MASVPNVVITVIMSRITNIGVTITRIGTIWLLRLIIEAQGFSS